MTTDEKQALRAQHTCTLRASSIGCRACDRGVPYPALTVAEVEEALAAGGRERKAAERVMPAYARRRR